jgi:flagellar motor switch protein FliN/FliY
MAQTSAGAARIIEHVSSALGESLSSMTGQTFTVSPGGQLGTETEGTIVWQQVFSSSSDPGIWLAVGKALWSAAGAMVLSAVGIEAAAEEDCRSTWLEIAGQTMGGLAMRITADVQHEVTAVHGEEVASVPEGGVTLTATCGEESWLFQVACAAELVALYDPRPASQPSTEATFSKTLDLLLDVALPVSVSFGKTVLAIREVLKLNTGSIVELNRLVSEPVEVIVNECVIARGEVVVVEGNYGVRILQLATREDRLRTGMELSARAAGAGR